MLETDRVALTGLLSYIQGCRKDLCEKSYVLRVPPNVSSFILTYCYNSLSMFVIVTAKRVTNVGKYSFNVKRQSDSNNLRNINNNNVKRPFASNKLRNVNNNNVKRPFASNNL
jgi:hypothetical protein